MRITHMWQSLRQSLERNTKYAVGLIAASVIGGATTAAVLAAIPDSTGQINACYTSGNKAALHLTDPAGNCKANETAIGWDRGAQAYAHITVDGNGQPVLDTANSAHIASVFMQPSGSVLCLTFDSTVVNPKQILMTKTHGRGDTSGAGLAALDGTPFQCPAGTDAYVDGGDGVPIPVFVRVY